MKKTTQHHEKRRNKRLIIIDEKNDTRCVWVCIAIEVISMLTAFCDKQVFVYLKVRHTLSLFSWLATFLWILRFLFTAVTILMETANSAGRINVELNDRLDWQKLKIIFPRKEYEETKHTLTHAHSVISRRLDEILVFDLDHVFEKPSLLSLSQVSTCKQQKFDSFFASVATTCKKVKKS